MSDTVVRSYHRTTRMALRCALIVVATFCVLRGVGYSTFFAPEAIPEGVMLISAFVPLTFWSWCWIAMGVLALAAAVPCWPAGSLGCIVMCLVWAVGFTVSWVLAMGDNTTTARDRDYLSASTYWTVLLLLGAGYILANNALRLSAKSWQPEGH